MTLRCGAAGAGVAGVWALTVRQSEAAANERAKRVIVDIVAVSGGGVKRE
jgi:hypothetical protein